MGLGLGATNCELWSLDSHCGDAFGSWILCNIIQQPIEPDERMDKYECELRGSPKPLTPARIRTSTAFQVGMHPHPDSDVRHIQQIRITRFAFPFELFATCEIHNIRPSRVDRMGRLYDTDEHC